MEMFKVLELMKQLTDEWTPDAAVQHVQPLGGSDRGRGRQEHFTAVTKELHQAWEKSQHSLLQLQTRLDMLLDWARGLAQDGGAWGEKSYRRNGLKGVLYNL